MAKVLWREDGDEFNKGHVGCMSGIFHALDYQYWHSNVRKILPHKKHDAFLKHAKRHRRNKRISDDEDPFEVLKLLDRETTHILVDQSNKKPNSPQKKSLKSRIKSLVSEDNINDKDQGSNFVTSPKLQRTYSIHHLETNEWVHPIIFFPENITESPVINSKRHSNVTISEINESRDILEMFDVDKDLFENILQDDPRGSDKLPKLTKSGSYPNLRPTKLNDKLNEFYTKSKFEKSKSKKLQDDVEDNNFMRIRRVSSLNESADKYAQLFDFSVSKEAVLRPSRSLKVTNGNDKSLSDQEPSFFKRIHSLRFDNLNNESRNNYFVRSGSQKERNPVSFRFSAEDSDCLDEVVDESDNVLEDESLLSDNVKVNSRELSEDMCELTVKEENVQSEFQISEDSDLSSNSHENLEKESKTFNINKHVEPSLKLYKDDDDFSYVKQILERSGFIKNGFQQTWYTQNQPLNPFIFQELESQYFHDPEHFTEDFNQLSHRLLIFELVDDVLINMYEKSLTYYPKELSSFCHIQPTPSGPRVLDDVWKRVTRLLDLEPRMDDSFNYIVDRDLRSDDGWMNLQLDSECVGLDLDDLIFDEILEELLFECS